MLQPRRYNSTVALGNHHLMHLEPWYDRWLLPCFRAYYRADEAELALQLATARGQLALEQFEPDERRALHYELAALQFYLDSLRLPPYHFEARAALLRAVNLVRSEPRGPLSASVQAYWLIAFCGLGSRLNHFDLDNEEYDVLFKSVSPRQRTQQFWYFVASRAFHHHDLTYLEKAAEAHSTEPTGFCDAFYFGCSRLMYRIVSGEVTQRDVTDFIGSLEHPNAVREFKNLFLVRCIESGVFDEQAATLLDKTAATLHMLEGTFPEPYRRRTMRMLENQAIYSHHNEPAVTPAVRAD
jgi:hypothetical protein